MPIKISIIDDFKSIFAGTKRLGEAFDDVADSLDNVGDDAKTTARTLDTQLDKAADSATDAARTTERKFSDAFNQVRRDAKQAGDTIDREVGSGTGKAGEAVGEFKQEALSNLSEVSSSFAGGPGSVTSAVDLVQGTLGGLAPALGPFGLAAAGMAALVGGAFAGVQVSAEEMKEKVNGYFEDMIASGNRYASETLIRQNIQDIIADQGKLDEATRVATAAGVEQAVALRAMAGDAEAAIATRQGLRDALAGERGAIDDLNARLRDGTNRTQADTEAIYLAIAARQDNMTHIEAQIGVIDREEGAWQKAREQTEAYQAAVYGSKREAQERAVASEQMARDLDAEAQALTRVRDEFGKPVPDRTVKFKVDDSEVRAWASRPVQLQAVARVGVRQAV